MSKAAIIADLKKLVSFQSVSADQKRFSEIEKAANFLKGKLKDIGCTVTTLSREGSPPCIIGVLESENPRAKTIGIYGHYDVQPEDPVEEWMSDPFILSKRDGKFYARGVADSKGHIIQNIAAIGSLILRLLRIVSVYTHLIRYCTLKSCKPE